MSKVKLGPQTLVYPQPAFLIGADVDKKSNFLFMDITTLASKQLQSGANFCYGPTIMQFELLTAVEARY